eukprot:14125485-Alexandrium_andersonii.AAC.1
MSASLVGSEMCIRDRAWRRWPWTGREGPRPLRRRLGLPRSGTPFLPRPVSYTHLTLPTICSV